MTKKLERSIGGKEVIAEFEGRRNKLTRLAIIIGVIVGAVSLLAYQSGISKMMTAIMLASSFIWAIIVHVKI
jgi:hypothetical protein